MIGMQINSNKNVELVACVECGCTWFSTVQANRYTRAQTTLNTEPQKVHYEADFYLLKCVKCGEVALPSIEGIQVATEAYNLHSEMVQEISESEEDELKKKTGAIVEKKVHGVWNHIPSKKGW